MIGNMNRENENPVPPTTTTTSISLSQVTDENGDLRVRAGLVPRRDLFRGVRMCVCVCVRACVRVCVCVLYIYIPASYRAATFPAGYAYIRMYVCMYINIRIYI
jgi:hypothetical protein